MGTRFDSISPKHEEFIQQQPLFFVATATADSTINLSPKGIDSFRILGPNRICWLNLTGSANESAAHIRHNPRMTIMFCAFSGAASILRLFGTARAIHHNDTDWQEYYELFPESVGARQIFEMQVDIVQVSCGYGVPLMDYQSDRKEITTWTSRHGETGIKKYWHDHNQTTIDGLETHILDLNMPK
ncbi:MAG: pyridoxamine 5'-phosphate oxidase family protein [Gammaproteobacteria bacterium]|nr:pyridoxamine 5'-phosphate oxidase family protein [Gammaproteobacteria bacterium]MCP4879146.1 pyridoxamine 5'-phosphate oxidase family protein [Gammaproteobacteria bacterium]MDP6165939.1 pyridoxamine 5'-phosphate oxidase family protein [Gammaproteobacteria bacterium]